MLDDIITQDSLEFLIQEKFKHLWERGEWYNYNNEIKEFSVSEEYKKIVKTYLYPVMLMQTIDSQWFYFIGVMGTVAFAVSGIAIAAKENATLLHLLAKWFNEKDNLSIQLMRIHLRACVDRGLRPGGKLDSLCILQGPQGFRKSTALKVLTPVDGAYDETTRVNFDSRDSLSALNSAYIYEFSEIEKILTTADVAQFKSWITRENDKYVEKFEHECKDHKRRCCLFGTTNASTYLMDPTGARRFLICETVKPANIELLKKLRDGIWKQSMVEFEDGLPHYLVNDSSLYLEDQQRAENATVSDPWEAELSSFLSKCTVGDFVTSQQLLRHLNKPVDKLDMRDCKRIGNIMKRLRWEKGRRRQAGHSNPVDGYIKPAQEVLTKEQAEAILDS